MNKKMMQFKIEKTRNYAEIINKNLDKKTVKFIKGKLNAGKMKFDIFICMN